MKYTKVAATLFTVGLAYATWQQGKATFDHIMPMIPPASAEVSVGDVVDAAVSAAGTVGTGLLTVKAGNVAWPDSKKEDEHEPE